MKRLDSGITMGIRLVIPLSFHSLVVGKVAVLLVAIVKVDSTSDAFVIVALNLKVVRLVTGLVEV